MEKQQENDNQPERVFEKGEGRLGDVIDEVINGFVESMTVVESEVLDRQERYILKTRLERRLRSLLSEHRDEYIDKIESENEELEKEIDLLSDEGTMDLRKEFEGMKNLVKFLLYREGHDGGSEQVRLTAHQVMDMRDVDMRHWWDEDADEIVIELEEYET